MTKRYSTDHLISGLLKKPIWVKQFAFFINGHIKQSVLYVLHGSWSLGSYFKIIIPPHKVRTPLLKKELFARWRRRRQHYCLLSFLDLLYSALFHATTNAFVHLQGFRRSTHEPMMIFYKSACTLPPAISFSFVEQNLERIRGLWTIELLSKHFYLVRPRFGNKRAEPLTVEPLDRRHCTSYAEWKKCSAGGFEISFHGKAQFPQVSFHSEGNEMVREYIPIVACRCPGLALFQSFFFSVNMTKSFCFFCW